MLKQRLQQKLLQKLSPQQIQVIKLLEIPTMQLEQRIKKELEENPTLEEGVNYEDEQYQEESANEEKDSQNDDEFTLEDYLNDEEIPSYRLSSNNYSKDDKREEIPFSTGISFHEHLENQLGLRVLDQHQKNLGLYLIGNIDDDGYLRRKLSAIADDLAFSAGVETDEDELEQILYIIHDFDPVGVGARDLQECLLIQIQSKGQTVPQVALARKILKYHFDEFTRKHYDKIQSKLSLSDEQLKEAIDEVLKLNPKPGGSFHDPHNRMSYHIVPDFILDLVDGELILSLNAKNVPDLKINREYSHMLESYAANRNNASKQEKEAVAFVKQKIDSAKWFIDAIRQRQNTLLFTMQAIIEYQTEFFKTGDDTKLKPMILKDIAEATGLDISTISRVANSKYIQTNFGIYSLKHFFSEGMQTDSGEEVSTKEIKKILQDCVGAEDKRKPLTDEKLMDILKEKGYPIARRTVAKYREQLGIPVARLRKEL
ncbi:MAG: RNA polymerase factor sigma-54 [Tenuifilaceae bacterium]|jgi:RNA polymerase sigma-54 factor|uniref:RNA polymerase factor sigma-54 n=1 Tax=Perlabentimonas gracilis TaxID=2715279 RepID=UPI00140C0EA0|nr:RNA polymerase factor sigma-54 [Perlabentimonas gracilis]MDX9771112.1 RNA polymerase factor sigma-54 [Tenuifilaceae bacterium]NHB68011.1 RNA polymerase factor sigma-54 [Perlabentimonas gracilis]